MYSRNHRVFAYRDGVKTRITVSFFFVFVRVISWIVCYAPRKAIHEITRTNTNEVPRQIRVLTQSSIERGDEFPGTTNVFQDHLGQQLPSSCSQSQLV